jgi:branched-chain amino acid aminotransferase
LTGPFEATAMPPTGLHGSVYLNGEIIPTAEARVSVLDRGFLWGDGVYEVTPCFNGQLFRLDQHIERLFSSIRFVGISLDISQDDLVAKTLEVVDLNRDVTSSHPICRVGHWVTRGMEEWVPIDEREGGATLCILVQPVGRTLAPEAYLAGVPLSVVATRRSPSFVLDPRVKTTSRMNPIVAEMEGSVGGALALMLDVNGHVAEGPTFNFFMVREGELVTPKAENVLPGITRRAVLELASSLAIPTREADLSFKEIATATEFFVTASTWGVLPVASVDRIVPRDEVPGDVTMSLIDQLARLTGYHPLGKAVL